MEPTIRVAEAQWSGNDGGGGGEVRTGAKVGVSERSDLAAKDDRRPAGGSMPGESVTGAAGLLAAVRPAAGEDMPRADMAVCGGIPQARQKWRQIGGRKVQAMARLDESKAAWIVRRKAEGGMTNRQIAEAMGVKVRWVQVLWPGYRHLSPAEI